MKPGDLLITNRKVTSSVSGDIPRGSVGIILQRKKDWFMNYEIIYYVYIQGTVTTMSTRYFNKFD